MMASQTLTVRLTGDGAWGFRLQGGTAPGMPLTVAKVRTKSKSFGVLEEGDQLVSINGYHCTDMSYDQVVDILDNVGSELVLQVVRSENKENVAPNFEPEVREFKDGGGEDVRDKDEKDLKPPPTPPPQQQQQTDDENEDETDEEQLTEEEDEEDLKQEPQSNRSPTFDVQTETETRISPDGSIHRSVRRELTASPFEEKETVTEVRDEKMGPLAARVATREEFTHQIGGDVTGFKTPSPIPPGSRSDSPMFKVAKFVPGASNAKAVTETFSKATTTTTSLSTNLSSFNDDLLNLTKKLDAGLNARTPTPTIVATPTPPSPPLQPASPPPSSVPPPPPPPSQQQRPNSMPSLDFNILDAIENRKIYSNETKTSFSKFSKTTTTKVGQPISDEESERFQKLMKAFKPPPEDEGSLTPTRKKKMFSSSSFYEEPRHIYPTVEEQVKLCKSIADSLSADTNQTSKGATMYIKRMKRAHKWVTEGPDPVSSDSESPQIHQSQSHPSFYKDGLPRLKLVLDPRGIQDPIKLAKTGIYNEHNVISPDICFDLVRDLNSPTGKGAQLFAKRKKKSEKWIVDENTVKETIIKHQNELPDIAARTPKTTPYRAPPPAKLKEINERLNPRVKYVKSPWEAALESPYGSCDGAFVEMKPKAPPLADFMWRESRAAAPPLPPLKDVFDVLPKTATAGPWTGQRSASPYGVTSDLYKPKMPKGWTGYYGDQSSSMYLDYTQQEQDSARIDYSTRPASSTETSFNKLSLDQFNNYNSTPTPWTEAKHRPTAAFKPVRPKSMVLTK